jgi:transposase
VTGSKRNADLEDVRTKLTELASAGRSDELITMVIELLARVRDDNTALQAKLHNALRALYGRKSEKVPAGQLALLFDELDEQAPAAAQQIVEDAQQGQEVEQPDAKPKPARGKGGRSPLPSNLPREPRKVLVPDELRACSKCGEQKAVIGHIRSELLEFVQAHFKIIEEEREKLACRSCGNGVVAADTQKPMDRGRPGPGLLAHIIVSKCQDSLPLYRQGQIYSRAGVTIAPSTLGDWFSFGCSVLPPVAAAIRARVLASLFVRVDDTPIPVQDKKHPKGIKRGHMWGYVGDNNLVVFDYTPTWEATGPRAFLRGFDGFVQGDGYAGFKTALTREDGEPIVDASRRLGCGMHVRRKFEQAADAGDARGAIALAYFRKIYDVERVCKEQQLDPEVRKLRRDELSLPVVDELYGWVRELHPRLVPGDKLHAATRYAINQEDAWRRCFSDGRFEIDNGEVERQIRRIALGRKNFLFAGSDKGAQRLADAYSVLGSCHMLGVNPVEYLADVLDRIQNGWPQARIRELVPDVWVADRRAAAPPVEGQAAAPNPTP